MIDEKITALAEKLQKIGESEEFDIYDVCQYHGDGNKIENAAWWLCSTLGELTDWEQDFIFNMEKNERWGVLPHVLRIWEGLEELKSYFGGLADCDAAEYERLSRIRGS